MDSNRALISHLLRRAGFGATPAELDQYSALGYQGTVDQLVNFDQVPDGYPAYAPTQLNANGKPKAGELQLWWLNRMLTTPRPLQEKMTLFWHGHFAVADSKVNEPVWMYNQNQLFRTNALGNFATLLKAISIDPAMMKWLDSETNTVGSPNENYGREVMELFTLGIGNYTEQDVKEGARALTGWTYKQDSTVGQFVPRRFDGGSKTYLGHTGNLGLDDVVSILAPHPATANFLATKLAKFFISDNPDQGTVQNIASTFSSTNGDIKQTVRSILLSDAFKDPAGFMNKVSSPAEWVVTNMRLLGAKAADQSTLAAMVPMGQTLFNPPNVAGWPGGTTWLNTDTIFSRLNFANHLLSGGKDASGVDPSAVLNGTSDPVGGLSDLLTDGLLNDANKQALQAYFTQAAKSADTKLRGLVHLVLSTPLAHMV